MEKFVWVLVLALLKAARKRLATLDSELAKMIVKILDEVVAMFEDMVADLFRSKRDVTKLRQKIIVLKTLGAMAAAEIGKELSAALDAAERFVEE